MPMMITWAGPEALPGMAGLDHVGLAVADLEAAVTLHTEGFGLRVEHRETNADQGVVEVMLTASSAGAPTTQLQLVAPDESSPVHRFLSRRGPVSTTWRTQSTMCEPHPAFSCGGLRLLYDAPRAGTRGSLINFVHPKDTGGVLIELVEHAAHNRGQG